MSATTSTIFGRGSKNIAILGAIIIESSYVEAFTGTQALRMRVYFMTDSVFTKVVFILTIDASPEPDNRIGESSKLSSLFPCSTEI